MSEVLEVVLELVFNVISVLAEAWVGDFSWPDTKASRILWSIVLALLGGLIWWELR